MRSTFRILFYINKSKTKADGTTAILCRITIDGASVVITTGESTAPPRLEREAKGDKGEEDQPTLANLSGESRTRLQHLALQIWSSECRVAEELLAGCRENSNDPAGS